jgi:hypothetical protein
MRVLREASEASGQEAEAEEGGELHAPALPEDVRLTWCVIGHVSSISARVSAFCGTEFERHLR